MDRSHEQGIDGSWSTRRLFNVYKFMQVLSFRELGLRTGLRFFVSLLILTTQFRTKSQGEPDPLLNVIHLAKPIGNVLEGLGFRLASSSIARCSLRYIYIRLCLGVSSHRNQDLAELLLLHYRPNCFDIQGAGATHVV